MNARHVTLALAVASSLVSMPASALVARAYVSGGGSDANTTVNCSLTQPCRTFQTAMTVLNDGGEVIALDSAGYGTVTITKSVSLIAPAGIFAGLTPTSGDAVTIATTGVNVVLKGLTINSLGGVNGITMTEGNSLTVDQLTIGGFSGTGISVQAVATVNVIDTVVRANTNGIIIGHGATANITGTRVLGNSAEGIELRSASGTGATTRVNVSDSHVSGSNSCVKNYETAGNSGSVHAIRVMAANCGNYAFINEPVGTGAMTVSDSMATNSFVGFYGYTGGSMTVSHSSASGNNYGFFNDGTMIVSNSTASNNVTGFHRGIGTFVSMGNNTVYGNTTNISGTITPAAQQ